MDCKYCESTFVRKNPRRCGKQNYFCPTCGHQFVEYYSFK
ncbi:IS1/IS1595 family N-terminal zinc-binding domain-containing protein [Microcoleus sp. B6-A1]